MNTWTFSRKIAAGFAIAVIAAIVVAVTGHRSTSSLIANDERVARTHFIRREIAALMSQLVNAETGQRLAARGETVLNKGKSDEEMIG